MCGPMIRVAVRKAALRFISIVGSHFDWRQQGYAGAPCLHYTAPLRIMFCVSDFVVYDDFSYDTMWNS